MQARCLIALAAVCAAGALAGCQSDGSHWRLNYRDMDVEPARPVDVSEVRIYQAHSVAELQFWPHLDGYRVMGDSCFTSAGELTGPNGEPGSLLRVAAAERGASFVRWANRPIRAAHGNFEERFEYFAVFYRTVGPQTIDQTFVNATDSPQPFERTLYASYEIHAPEPGRPSTVGPTELAGAGAPIDSED